MVLKYAVVSSDSNPEYLDFWPYVAKAWRNLIGIEPVLFYVDKNPPTTEILDYGRVFYMPSIQEWPIAQQTQCIRFWAAKVLDGPFIISDIDMLPISKNYYLNGAAQIGDSGIVSYSSDIIKYRWYKTNPQYPMCYLAGDPKSFIDLLELHESDYKDFFKRLMKMNLRFGTDQKFFYNQSIKNRDCYIKHLERGWIDEKYATGRLDKVIWPKSDYNASEYIDCHLPRSFSSNRNVCNDLFKKLNLL